MSSKTMSILFCVFFLFSATGDASVWRVDNNPGNTNADFVTLQAAHDGVASNDTLYVIGSGLNYGSLTMTKPLTIIGPGFFLAENPQTQANPASAKVGAVIVDPGAAGTFISGMEFTGLNNVNTNNVTLKRNLFRRNDANDYLITTGGNVTNFTLTQCYVLNKAAAGHAVQIGGTNSNILITNNMLESNAGSDFALNCNASSTVEVVNNIFLGKVTLDESILDNNVTRGGTVTATQSTPRNNIGTSTQFPAGNGNQQNVLLTDIFLLTGSTDGQWILKPGSPAIGNGVNGEDIGMYGGSDPYVLSGVPAIPAIYFFSAPTSGSSGAGLPVHIKVKSNN